MPLKLPHPAMIRGGPAAHLAEEKPGSNSHCSRVILPASRGSARNTPGQRGDLPVVDESHYSWWRMVASGGCRVITRICRCLVVGVQAPEWDFCGLSADSRMVFKFRGQHQGDLLHDGGELILRGQVSGDVTCTAGVLHVRGQIAGELTVDGGDVTLRGMVNGRAAVVSGRLLLAAGCFVGGRALSDSGEWYTPTDAVHVTGDSRTFDADMVGLP
ncbi:hypothetical protein [Microbacterium sp. A93]|uniref:hypothetical protein n=1 Tax=Microbacterium sp. A93 TaxID=3450716 RepID=UPI003F42AF2E